MPIQPVFPGGSAAASSDMELLFSTTLTSTQTTISTGTLPTGYRDLVIRGQVRSDAAFIGSGVFVAFNGDTTNANYSYVRDFSTTTQSSFESNIAGKERKIAIIAAANAAANTFGVFTLTIYSHESTTNLKSYNTVSGSANTAASMDTSRFAGKRLSTDAITTISFSLVTGDFVAGSSIAVYGLK